MKEETIARLNALNRAFYGRFADEFSRTRAKPWAGWEPILDCARNAGGRLSVLDAGCGNGRFGAYLLDGGVSIARYVGLDSAPALLAEAKLRLAPCVDGGAAADPRNESRARTPRVEGVAATDPRNESRARRTPCVDGVAATDPRNESRARRTPCVDGVAATDPRNESRARRPTRLSVEPLLLLHDVVEHRLEAAIGAERFSLAAAIGILHHIPSRILRNRCFLELARSVAPGGLLAASIWQFAAFERFQRRIADWSEHEQQSGIAIDPRDLEPGDHLLHWGADGLRYCHFVDREEEAELLLAGAQAGLVPLQLYVADGAEGVLNHYLLLERPRA